MILSHSPLLPIVACINSKLHFQAFPSLTCKAFLLLFPPFLSPSSPCHSHQEFLLISRAQYIMSSDSDLTDLSSELSSIRSSLSPPPIFGYPSPQSSQDNSNNVSDSQQSSHKRSLDSNDVPPAKKRKSLGSRPRTTVHLDLRAHSSLSAIGQTTELNLLLKTLRRRRKIVVVAGAGISTSAGGSKHCMKCYRFPH